MAPAGKRAKQKRNRDADSASDDDEWVPSTQRADNSDFEEPDVEEPPAKVLRKRSATAKPKRRRVNNFEVRLAAVAAVASTSTIHERLKRERLIALALQEARNEARAAVRRDGTSPSDANANSPERERPLLWTPPAVEAARATRAQAAQVEAARASDRAIDDVGVEGAEDQRVSNLRIPVPSLLNQTFSDWGEFEAFVEEYQKEHSVVYRFRDSLSVEAYNLSHPHVQLPSRFQYAYRKCFCTLGCKQKPRGDGRRTQRKNRYQGCGAFFRAKLVQVDDGDELRWVVRVVKEHHFHNHNRTKAIYAALVRGRDLVDDTLLEQLDAFVETNTDTRQITDYFSSRLDLPLSSQQIRNLINARLGSGNAEARVKQLLGRFVAKDGNSCLLIEDESGLTCGISIQNAAQKEIFRRWGDTLVLDWTHNTNNLGFYMGSLVTTVVTGRGVSVLDYLCVNQKRETLIAVINHFKTLNPTWQSVQSIVIDKDFTQWSALKSVFPSAKILLCQFHMISYFRRIMGGSKYFVPITHRNAIEELVYGMIYAPNKVRYEEAVFEFKKSTRKVSRSLVSYFENNWNSCSDMWANYGRRECFSGGNTTSNRIEASWNQFKQLLGKTTSIDRCLAAIIQQQVCVIRQVQLDLTYHEVLPSSVAKLPSQLQPLCQVLSEYCLRRVQKQWDLYIAHCAQWTWNSNGDTFTGSAGGTPVTVTFRSNFCCCDCLFYRSTALPCQHVFAVCEVTGTGFEVVQLHKRWSMVEAQSTTPVISSSITDLVEVRMRREEPVAVPIDLPDRNPRITYAKVKRREVCEQAVLSGNEKYNIVHSELIPLISAMQALPTHMFYRRFADLRSTIQAFGEKWELNLGPDGAVGDEDEDEALNVVGADTLHFEDDISATNRVTRFQRDDAGAAEAAKNIDNVDRVEQADQEPVGISGGVDSVIGAQGLPSNITGKTSMQPSSGLAAVELDTVPPNKSAPSAKSDISDDSDIPFYYSEEDGTDTGGAQPGLPLSLNVAATPASQVTLPDLEVSELSQKLIASTSALLKRVDEAIDEDVPRSLSPKQPQRNKLSAIAPVHRGKGKLASLRKKMNWEEPPDSSSNDESSDSGDSEYVASQEVSQRQVTQLPDRLSVIRLPRPVKQTSKGSKRRTTAVVTGDCPIRLDIIVDWANNNPDLQRVGTVLKQYPVAFKEIVLLQRNPTVSTRRGLQLQYLYTFVIPRALIMRVNSAFVQWLEDTGTIVEPTTRAEISSNIPVAYIAGGQAGFSLEYLGQCTRFYETLDATETFKLDLAWVLRDWSHHRATAVLFLPSISTDTVSLAKEVAQLLTTVSLATRFLIPVAKGTPNHRPTTISLRELLGRLARSERVNDTVIHAMLQIFCCRYPGTFALDPVAVRSRMRIALPEGSLFSYRCIVVPVHLKHESHWIIQVVIIEPPSIPDGKLNIRPLNYDPLGLKKNIHQLSDLWTDYTMPLLQFWYNRDYKRRQQTSNDKQGVIALYDPKNLTCAVTDDLEAKDDNSGSNVGLGDHNTGIDSGSEEANHDKLSQVAAISYETGRDDIVTPLQEDGCSCGIFCLAFAESMMRGSDLFTKQERISAIALETIRLRMMAEILKLPTKPDDRWIEICEINMQVNKFFPEKS